MNIAQHNLRETRSRSLLSPNFHLALLFFQDHYLPPRFSYSHKYCARSSFAYNHIWIQYSIYIHRIQIDWNKEVLHKNIKSYDISAYIIEK
jgi:hypothetical protein